MKRSFLTALFAIITLLNFYGIDYAHAEPSLEESLSILNARSRIYEKALEKGHIDEANNAVISYIMLMNLCSIKHGISKDEVVARAMRLPLKEAKEFRSMMEKNAQLALDYQKSTPQQAPSPDYYPESHSMTCIEISPGITDCQSY